MKTLLFTYLFAIAFISSIALPTYISLSKKTCEYELLLSDFEDDSEQTEKNLDTDVKIIHSFQEITSYKQIIIQHSIAYLSSTYNTLSLKIDSPPPEVS